MSEIRQAIEALVSKWQAVPFGYEPNLGHFGAARQLRDILDGTTDPSQTCATPCCANPAWLCEEHADERARRTAELRVTEYKDVHPTGVPAKCARCFSTMHLQLSCPACGGDKPLDIADATLPLVPTGKQSATAMQPVIDYADLEQFDKLAAQPDKPGYPVADCEIPGGEFGPVGEQELDAARIQLNSRPDWEAGWWKNLKHALKNDPKYIAAGKEIDRIVATYIAEHSQLPHEAPGTYTAPTDKYLEVRCTYCGQMIDQRYLADPCPARNKVTIEEGGDEMKAMNYRSFARWIAWRLPHAVVYWVLIRAWSNATSYGHSNSEAPGMTIGVVMDRWKERDKESTP